MNVQIPIQAWRLKQRDPNIPFDLDGLANGEGQWLEAHVPGTVYQTLLEAGQIPDPYYGLNELEVQWVAEADWIYQAEFEVDETVLQAPFVDVLFEGLDTFATVWLNGRQILESDNMFVPQRVGVKDWLKPGTNTLHILFESALRKGRELEQRYGKRGLWNGDSSRLYVRKAQYHYGWDWGPTLLTAGPWKPVRLEAYSARIAHLHCPVLLSPDHRQASFQATVQLAGHLRGHSLVLELIDPQGQVLQTAALPTHSPSHTFTVSSPQLWWPNGYGAQPLYTLKARLMDGTEAVEQTALRLGVRSLEVVQEGVAGEAGSSFYFRVNHTPIFGGGANWIPDDNLLTRISPQRYRQRVAQAADAHMVMLRVWGGGIYEDEAFYDACDELGILVWQDFLFACGLYPAHPGFLNSVRLEAEAALLRLRHRASLALWCGNNEDYAIAESYGWYGPGKDTRQFVALEIYEQLLPEVCSRLDPTRLYWPGSPYTPGGAVSSESSQGDRHSWEVWHGPMYSYQDYRQFAGRFVSEFGMQALPSIAALERYIPAEERFPQSRTLTHHNKATNPASGPDGHRRLAVYLSDNLRDYPGLEGHVYVTQFVQAEAMHYAYRDFRRGWGREGQRGVGGALLWQLNDCWPVTSWAIIDSLGLPKPSYYLIKRALAPLALGLVRNLQGVEVFAMSGLVQGQDLELELEAFDIEGQRVNQERRPVHLSPNQTTELGIWEGAQTLVYAARLWQGKTVVARAADWPQPYKFYRWPDPGLSPRLEDGQLRLNVSKPAKGVWIEGLSLNDNFLDLFPGDEQVVLLHQPIPQSLKLRWLDSEWQRLALDSSPSI